MGLGVFWKPVGPTSNEYLADIKTRLIKQNLCPPGPLRKGIGHAGSLDPFADGLLLVGWEEGTKFLAGLKGLDKTYIADIRLGSSTPTLDNTVPSTLWKKDWIDSGFLLGREKPLEDFLSQNCGPQMQIPPEYSAKKIAGRPAYQMARKGLEVALEPREIRLHRAKHLDLKQVNANEWCWTVEVKVSTGTYIRAFARDWAQKLFGEPGHLTGLRRTEVGQYSSLGQQDYLFSNTQELAWFFQTTKTDLEASSSEQGTNLGRLLVGEDGSLKAAWIQDSAKWRYFNGNPL